MPRNDGRTPEHPRRHHKAMHSARKGRGADKKLKAAKMAFGDRRGRCPECHIPTADVSRHKRHAHPI